MRRDPAVPASPGGGSAAGERSSLGVARFAPVISVLLLLALAGIVLAATLDVSPEEDAFIYYRYAHNFRAGHGLVFNPGERSEGFSSAVWVWTLAGLALLTPALPQAAPVLGLVCAAATLLVTWRLAALLSLPPFGRWAALATVAWSYPFLLWARSGLETPFYSLAVVSAVYLFLRAEGAESESRAREEWWAGGTLFLAAVARPEGVLLPLVALFRRRSLAAAVALLGFASFLCWRWWTFGSLVPSTSVKMQPLQWQQAFGQLGEYAVYLGVLPAILPLVVLALRLGTPDWRSRVRFLLLVCGVVSVGFHLLAGGDYRWGFRFLVPTLPLLAIAFWSSLCIASRGLASPALRWSLRGAALAMVLGGSMVSTLHAWARPPDLVAGWRELCAPLHRGNWHAGLGIWLVEHVPEGSSVAVAQMGKAPYYSTVVGHPLVFIDTLGVVNGEISAIHRLDRRLQALLLHLRRGETLRQALAAGRRERAVAVAHYLLRRAPDFVLIETGLLGYYAPLDELLATPEFRARYVELPVDSSLVGFRVFRRAISVSI